MRLTHALPTEPTRRFKMSSPEIVTLEIKLFQFLTYIPKISPLTHRHDPMTGIHCFMNAEGYIEKLELSHEEFQYLVAQHRLPGRFA